MNDFSPFEISEYGNYKHIRLFHLLQMKGKKRYENENYYSPRHSILIHEFLLNLSM
jgi:hypothetical protein